LTVQKAAEHAKEEKEWSGWDLSGTILFPWLLHFRYAVESCLYRELAEVVGSTPTRSIFINPVKYGIVLSSL
jgi:hypothetical protein